MPAEDPSGSDAMSEDLAEGEVESDEQASADKDLTDSIEPDPSALDVDAEGGPIEANADVEAEPASNEESSTVKT